MLGNGLHVLGNGLHALGNGPHSGTQFMNRVILRSERVSESGNFYDFSGSLPINSFYFDIISKEGVCE